MKPVKERLDVLLRQRIMIMDGAMGTVLQQKDLTPNDFGGAAYEGCNEYLNLTRPDVVEEIYRSYLQSGADIIETNTFGGTAIVLADYQLEQKVGEINRAGAELARRAVDQISQPDRPRFVAGSMGPTTKTLTVTGGVTFDELVENFEVQSRALIEGGVDLLLLETVQDTLNLKAAAIGVGRAQAALKTSLPLMVSGTIEPMGTTLAGQPVESFYTSLEHLDLFSIGLNCATGPEFMTDHLRSLALMSTCWVSVYPNAGLPDEDGHYVETPESLAEKVSRFVQEGWVNIVGGCCGTTPAHIAALSEMIRDRAPRVPETRTRLSVSGVDFLTIDEDIRPVLVGERTNQTGSRRFRDLIEAEKFEEAAEIGRAQARNGAHILDVNMDSTQRDNAEDMENFLKILNRLVRIPIMLDSTSPEVLEAGLKNCQGKCVINSINLEDGEDRFQKVVPLLKQYGGAVIVGCIDESGQAIQRDKKLEVVRRSLDLLVHRYGLQPRDLIFDPLVFPTATGDKNYDGSAPETIEAVRMIRQEFPACKTILGISNVSFGLPAAGREVLNSVFLYHAVQAGLDFAIVNTQKLERYPSIPEAERNLCEDLLFWRGDDPIAKFANAFRGRKAVTKKTGRPKSLDKRLANYIVEGTKEGLVTDLDQSLKKRPPLEIINGPLMAGMSEVGRLFNDNQLIVAEVLQSAEAMKAAVSHLEPFMEKSESATRGKVILATVKGDVHDIGKNLVEIILGNNGYRVVNLGIKVAPDELIKAYKREKPDAIGLSGLLVKSAQQMVSTVQDFQSAGVDVPVLVGGAALTKRFAATRIAPQYPHPVIYASDAMQGLDLVNQLTDDQKRDALLETTRQEYGRLREVLSSPKPAKPARPKVGPGIRRDHPLPTPADYDLHLIRKNNLKKVFDYINPAMLYGRHLGLRGGLEQLLAAGDEKAVKLKSQVEELQEEVDEKDWILADGIYRFFPCQSRGDDLLVYDPSDPERILETFSFPRQSSGEQLCLSDYCRDINSGERDAVAMFAVTCGRGIRERAQSWKEKGECLRSHMIQALAIEAAEAFAEIVHRQIRSEWGFPDSPELTIRDILKNQYRGIRVSFGYPACPDLADQQKLFKLLNPSQIHLTLTDGDMMDPEAAVSALVFHHPDARYFRTDTE